MLLSTNKFLPTKEKSINVHFRNKKKLARAKSVQRKRKVTS